MECISRAQTTHFKLTGMFGRFGVKNLSEVFSFFLCLKFREFWCSSSPNEIRCNCSIWWHLQNSDCENRATRNWKQVVLKRHGGSWVIHVPFQKWKEIRRYVWLIRSDITSTHPVSSLVQDWMGCLHPLLVIGNATSEQQKKTQRNVQNMKTAAERRGFTSFQMVHTHASLPRGFFLFPPLMLL